MAGGIPFQFYKKTMVKRLKIAQNTVKERQWASRKRGGGTAIGLCLKLNKHLGAFLGVNHAEKPRFHNDFVTNLFQKYERVFKFVKIVVVDKVFHLLYDL
jgi:hypothetical protein